MYVSKHEFQPGFCFDQSPIRKPLLTDRNFDMVFSLYLIMWISLKAVHFEFALACFNLSASNTVVPV